MPPEYVRIEMFYALMRKLARRNPKTYFQKLAWFLKQERGTAFSREHFHFQIALLPSKKTNDKTCKWLEACWKSIVSRRSEWLLGTSCIRVFDPARRGLIYNLKNEGDETDNDCESGKFGPKECELMLSLGLRNWLGLR